MSEKELKFYSRWEWFWSSRVDKKGDMKKLHKAMEKFLKESELKSTPVLPLEKSASWQCIGPFNYTLNSKGEIGRVSSIWADPANHNTILAGGQGYGIYKTTNGGTTWNNISSPSMIGGVSDIAVHPTNKNIIYVTTGIHTSGYEHKNYATGIWKSTNGGSTWYRRNGNLNLQALYITKLIISPYNPDVLFALSDYHIYKSTNGGSSWTLTLSAKRYFDSNGYSIKEKDQKFCDIVFDPQHASAYVYVSGFNCFYTTNNMCGYWVDRSTTVGNSSTWWRFNIDCNVGHKLFGYYRSFTAQGAHQLLVSNARTISWTKQTLQFNTVNARADVDLVLKVLPDNYVFVGAVTSMRYFYNGTSFTDGIDLDNLHVDTREFCFPDNTKNTVFVGHDGGISKNNLPNNKTYFSQINGNLALNSCYGLDIYEPDQNMYLIGVHDNGTHIKTSSYNWKNIKNHPLISGYSVEGDGGICAIDKNDPDRLFYMSNGCNYWTNTQGYISAPVGGGLEFIQRKYDSPFLIDPSNSRYHYAAGTGATIFKSDDYGKSFDDTPFVSSWGLTTAFAVAPSNSNYMLFAAYNRWVTNEGHLERTYSGGTAWYEAEVGLSSIIGKAKTTHICYDRTNFYKAWICFGGFEQGKKVYKSGNGGYSWTNISSGLPDLPVNTLVYDDERNCLYAGTDAGVYFLTDGNSTWYPMGYGLPRAIVTNLKINFTYNKLVASTWGAGVWTYNLGTKSGYIGGEGGDIEGNKNKEFQNSEFSKNNNNNLMKVMPNPVIGQSEIRIDDEIENGKITIYSIDGKLVKEFTSLSGSITINNTDFDEGLYLIRLEQNGIELSSQKILIRH